MKKRIFTLALVVLFALTLMPLIASADDNLHQLDAPTDFEGSGHWGWSMGAGTLPGNMRGIDGLIIEFDIDSDSASFIVQSPAGGWWDQVDDLEWENGRLEITFADHWEDWETYRTQYAMHLVFGNWQDHIAPENVTGAWLVGEVFPDPQFEPGDVNPVLAPPTDFEGSGHWGWSMRYGSLPWNMSEITGIIIEFDTEPGAVDFVIQSPAAGWWEHPGATEFSGNTLEITFADWSDHWDAHIEQYEMHLVIGNWDDMKPENVVSAQLIGEVAEGVPSPEAGEVRELPPPGTLPFDMGLGGMIWGNEFTQLGWNGDTRAIDNDLPFAGEGGLTAGLLLEADWFVIYVDNAPDDYEHEMLELVIFGNANGWSWEGGTMEAPTVQIYDTFVPGAIAFPIGGHPYIEAIRQAGEDELENRNFGISFQYDGGIENLGITGVMLYAELPAAPPAPEPPPPPAPEPPPPAPEPTPAPAAATGGGFPWWGWVLIVVGAGAIVCVIVVVTKKKK